MAFSNKLLVYDGELSKELEQALMEIQQHFSDSSLRVLKYDSDNIVVPIQFSVSIPPRGTVGGINIQPKEPMMIKLSLTRFPYRAPLIISDREDFPKEKLTHLYACQNNEPARLCLVRNSPDEWFSGRRIADVLTVAEQWLFKAATGQLSEDGNEFAPLRLEGFDGYHSYKYETVYDVVKQDQRLVSNVPMAAMLTYFDAIGSMMKTLSPVPFIQVEPILQFEKELHTTQSNTSLPFPYFSMLVWNGEETINTDYLTRLPSNFSELVDYFKKDGIDITEALSVYFQVGLNLRVIIPIIHALRRPKKIVGYPGEFEFINFNLDVSRFTSTDFPPDSAVSFQSHIEPFSASLAQKVSGETCDTEILFVGAGSLGSKLIFHEARKGNHTIGVADHDKFLYHNQVRHVLGANRIGQNKAEGIIDEISGWFEFDTHKKLNAYPVGVEALNYDVFKKYRWLVDSTASLLVQNWLSKQDFPEDLRVARCELADDGRLGLLYIEGENRNPRMDDLINLTYFYGHTNMAIQGWRRRDAKREVTTLDVGLGCSSTTSIMADDTISAHSSIFSKVLKKEQKSNRQEGLLHLSMLEVDSDVNMRNETLSIKPFEPLQCQAGSGWEIRLMNGLSKAFIRLCKEKGKIETGGSLVGVANYKTKTIHIFAILKEPQDSKGTCMGFVRGVHGLPRAINSIKENTGGVIGYIGEWHTHPMDLERLSTTDLNTIQDLNLINRKTPIPTLAIIVTNEKILPFVFE